MKRQLFYGVLGMVSGLSLIGMILILEGSLRPKTYTEILEEREASDSPRLREINEELESSEEADKMNWLFKESFR